MRINTLLQKLKNVDSESLIFAEDIGRIGAVIITHDTSNGKVISITLRPQYNSIIKVAYLKQILKKIKNNILVKVGGNEIVEFITKKKVLYNISSVYQSDGLLTLRLRK